MIVSADRTQVANAAETTGLLNPSAFWLSVAGLAIQGLSALMLGAMYPFFSRFGGMMGFYPGMMGGFYGGGWYGLMWWWIALSIAAIAIGVVGVGLMSSKKAGRFRSGAVLVLVGAVLAFPVMWGFWIGSTLMFIGGVLGLTSGLRP